MHHFLMKRLGLGRTDRIAVCRIVPGLVDRRRPIGALCNTPLATWIALVALMICGLSTTQSQAASQCVRIEIYVKDDCKECKPAEVELNTFAEKRAGVIVRTFNVDTEPKYA